jgi:hypothetical protein
VWASTAEGTAGYGLAVDADGNAYASRVNANNSNLANTSKFDASDGTWSQLVNSRGSYACVVDDDMGVIISGGHQIGVKVANLWVTSLDGTENDSMLVGGANGSSSWLLGTGQVITFDGDIYVIIPTPDETIYKIGWDGSSLSLIDSVVGPVEGEGLFFDIYDNLVIVNQKVGGGKSDVFHYYDTDLNALSVIDGFNITTLRNWAAAGGGAWRQGDAFDDGVLAVPGTPAVPGVDPNFVEADPYSAGLELCVYADGVPIGTRTTVADANGTIVIDVNDIYDTVIAGINYYSVYESLPLTEKKTRIRKLALDFYETLGCHVGVSQALSSDLRFSPDAFATRQDMVTGFKFPTFLHGWDAEPIVYLWEWDPIPATIRGMYVDTEVVR